MIWQSYPERGHLDVSTRQLKSCLSTQIHPNTGRQTDRHTQRALSESQASQLSPRASASPAPPGPLKEEGGGREGGRGENFGIRGCSPEEAADSPADGSHQQHKQACEAWSWSTNHARDQTQSSCVSSQKDFPALPQAQRDLCIEPRLLLPQRLAPAPASGGHTKAGLRTGSQGAPAPGDTESFCPLTPQLLPTLVGRGRQAAYSHNSGAPALADFSF